jgi:hypothetical protein
MFCPNCGKENSTEIKFCASCGTNLEAVSQALTGVEEDFFTKIDTGIDQFIARYSDHVFKNNRLGPNEHKVVNSWQLLGKGVITSFLDLLLFILMWNFLPLRFMLLLISTPFRLLSERSRERRSNESLAEGYNAPKLNAHSVGQLPPEPVPSVTEDTTVRLGVTGSSKKETAPITDQLK